MCVCVCVCVCVWLMWHVLRTVARAVVASSARMHQSVTQAHSYCAVGVLKVLVRGAKSGVFLHLLQQRIHVLYILRIGTMGYLSFHPMAQCAVHALRSQET